MRRSPSHETSANEPLLAWLAAEPFTLVLSSSFFGFYAFAGVLASLEEAGLAPACVCGSSGGALAAAIWSALGSGRKCIDLLLSVDPRSVVGAPQIWPPGLFTLRGSELVKLLPCQRLEECPVPASASTVALTRRGLRLTVHRHGEIRSVIPASCAVPLLFAPVRIGPHYHWDGGVLDTGGLLAVPSDAPRRVLYVHNTLFPLSCVPDAKCLPSGGGRVSLRIYGLPLVPFIDRRRSVEGAMRATRAALHMRVHRQGLTTLSLLAHDCGRRLVALAFWLFGLHVPPRDATPDQSEPAPPPAAKR